MEKSCSRRVVMLGAIGLAAAGTAGCSSDPEPAASPSSPASSSSSTSPPADTRPRWPLTGRLVKDPDAVRHAPVAVKVPDNKYEHPQRGLGKADIVFVQLEGYLDAAGFSATRLMPVFHTSLPEAVNPVRSLRPVDAPLLAPIGAVVGNTGAMEWVVNYIAHVGQYVDGSLSYMNTRGTGAYSMDSSRIYSQNGQTYYDRAVVANPKVLSTLTRQKRIKAGPRQPYFPWASSDAEVSTAASGKPASRITVPWKPGHAYDMTYAWSESKGKYLRSEPWGPHVLADGSRVAPDNVLVIRAKQRTAKLYTGAGHADPVHDIIDSKGTFYYAHGGRVVTGTWRKGAVQTPFVLTLDDGSPLRMAPGQTYVELPRIDAKVAIRG